MLIVAFRTRWLTWQAVHHGGDEPVKFENLHEDVEVALLPTLEMLVQNLNELGAGGSWHCFHQLKLIYTKAVLEERHSLRTMLGGLCMAICVHVCL